MRNGSRSHSRISISTRPQWCGVDKGHDLALLLINNAPNLQPATLADSQNLTVGQRVYAIGNHLGCPVR